MGSQSGDETKRERTMQSIGMRAKGNYGSDEARAPSLREGVGLWPRWPGSGASILALVGDTAQVLQQPNPVQLEALATIPQALDQMWPPTKSLLQSTFSPVALSSSLTCDHCA